MKRLVFVLVVGLLGVSLVLGIALTQSLGENRRVAKLKKAAAESLERELESLRKAGLESTPKGQEYARALQILKISGGGQTLAAPFAVCLHELRNPDYNKVISFQWLDTGNEVTGFFLVLGKRTMRFPVLNPNSEHMRELAETARKDELVFLFQENTQIPDSFRELQRTDGFPSVSVPASVLEQLFLDRERIVRVGLLLKEGKTSATCKLLGPYLQEKSEKSGVRP